MRARVIVTVAAAMLLALHIAAGARPAGDQMVYRGKSMTMGSGQAWAWISCDRQGHPLAIGITLAAAALDNLPAKDSELPLPLPTQARATVFRQAVLNWNPHGHPPAGVYDVPHFDFHFYTISERQRAAITTTGADRAASERAPERRYLPPGYVPAPPAEPRMGLHWVNPAFPELHGQPFIASLIYGTYDGRLAFIEPMVTLALLQQKTGLSRPVSQPQAYQVQGYFPTTWEVSWDAAERTHTVALGGMRKR